MIQKGIERKKTDEEHELEEKQKREKKKQKWKNIIENYPSVNQNPTPTCVICEPTK